MNITRDGRKYGMTPNYEQDLASAKHFTAAVRSVKVTREAGRIERCHNVPHLGSYSNAAHTYGVLHLAVNLFNEDFPKLVDLIMDHDVPERFTGDIPANVLRSDPAVREACHRIETEVVERFGLASESFHKESDPDLYAKFKACDRIELYLWCCEQLEQGNQGVRGVMFELERVWAKDPPPEPASSFIRHVQQHGWARLPESLEDIV